MKKLSVILFSGSLMLAGHAFAADPSASPATNPTIPGTGSTPSNDTSVDPDSKKQLPRDAAHAKPTMPSSKPTGSMSSNDTSVDSENKKHMKRDAANASATMPSAKPTGQMSPNDASMDPRTRKETTGSTTVPASGAMMPR